MAETDGLVIPEQVTAAQLAEAFLSEVYLRRLKHAASLASTSGNEVGFGLMLRYDGAPRVTKLDIGFGLNPENVYGGFAVGETKFGYPETLVPSSYDLGHVHEDEQLVIHADTSVTDCMIHFPVVRSLAMPRPGGLREGLDLLFFQARGELDSDALTYAQRHFEDTYDGSQPVPDVLQASGQFHAVEGSLPILRNAEERAGYRQENLERMTELMAPFAAPVKVRELPLGYTP